MYVLILAALACAALLPFMAVETLKAFHSGERLWPYTLTMCVCSVLIIGALLALLM